MGSDIYPGQSLITPLQLGVIGRIRRLWIEVSVWVRDLALTTMRDTEREPSIANRLFVDVIDDFYEIFNTYYDSDIAQQFVNLLSGIFTSLWDLMRAFKENDQNAVNTSVQQLYQRVDEFSGFLDQINFFWVKEQWQNLFYQYIRLKIEQITNIARGNFEEEVRLYDRIEDIAVLMGNYMAGGLIAGSQLMQENLDLQL